MATSGTSTFNATQRQIVYGALRIVGAYASTDSPRAEQVEDAVETLNMMLKQWRVEGFLWLKQFAYLWLVKGQNSYILSAASTDHCTTSYVATNTKANYPATTTTLDVTSTAGFASGGGHIAVYLDDGTVHWTSIASTVDPDTVTLAVGLPSQASTGAAVVYYTSDIVRPSRILSATRLQSSGYEIPMTCISREDYQRLPNKTTQGKPVQYYYDPQRDSGVLYVWPTPDGYDDKLVLNCDRQLEDMSGETETFDIPQEWMQVTKYGLACRLAPEYGVPMGERQLLLQEYTAMRETVLNYDRDFTSTFFTPGR